MDDRVEEIREREQGVTQGPWISTLSDGHPRIVVPNEGDLAFITHARQDIPYLLDRLQAAEERASELEKELRRTGCFCGPVDEPDPMEHREDCAYRVAMERIAAREALREGER